MKKPILIIYLLFFTTFSNSQTKQSDATLEETILWINENIMEEQPDNSKMLPPDVNNCTRKTNFRVNETDKIISYEYKCKDWNTEYYKVVDFIPYDWNKGFKLYCLKYNGFSEYKDIYLYQIELHLYEYYSLKFDFKTKESALRAMKELEHLLYLLELEAKIINEI